MDEPFPETTVSDDDRIGEYQPDIFQNKELLFPTYVPETDRIVGRDEELRKIEEVMKPAAHGDPPGDAAIISKAGTGKTLCVKNVAARVREYANQNSCKAVPVYINCGDTDKNTAWKACRTIAVQVNNYLGDPRDIPKSGYSGGRYLNIVWEMLEDATGFIVILDEVDKLGDGANEVLKMVADAESDGLVDNVGKFIISNKRTAYDDLDSRVKSRFANNDRELVFAPYDANQLRAILERRKDAFRDGVLTDDVIPLTAAIAGQKYGDARSAVDILREAGKIAQRSGSEQVTQEHVYEAGEQPDVDRDRILIKKSLDHAQCAIFALAYLTKTTLSSGFTTSDIYEVYEEVTECLGWDAQTQRRVRDHLGRFDEINMVDVVSRGAGRSRIHELEVSEDLVLTVVENEVGDEETNLLTFLK